MPIISVDEFRHHCFNHEVVLGARRASRRKKSRALDGENALEERQERRFLFFCSNDVDSMLSMQILMADKMFRSSDDGMRVKLDVLYISSVEDVFAYIKEQYEAQKEYKNLQLFQYQKVVLIGFGGHIFTNTRLHSEIRSHFSSLFVSPEEKEDLQFCVLDFRRPYLPLFNYEESWFLVVDTKEFDMLNKKKFSLGVFGDNSIESEDEEVEGARKSFSMSGILQESQPPGSKMDFSKMPKKELHGCYESFPLCLLANAIVQDAEMSEILIAKKGFLTSVGLFWHFSQQFIDTQDYEEMLDFIKFELHQKRRMTSSEESFTSSSNYGILPFLPYSCLRSALDSSEHIFANTYKATAEERDSKIRMECGVTRKEMLSHQAEFRITNKERQVLNYLKKTYGETVSTLDWSRREYPNLNNAAVMHFFNFILAYSKGNEKQPYAGNCRDFLEIADCLLNISLSRHVKLESNLLKLIPPASQNYLGDIFSTIKTNKIEGKRCGGETVWLLECKHLGPTLYHPVVLRSIALLCSNYKAKGVPSRRYPTILVVSKPPPSNDVVFYIASPNSDKNHPDIWPALIRFLENRKLLKQNGIYPNLAVTSRQLQNEAKQMLLQAYRRRFDAALFSSNLRKKKKKRGEKRTSASFDYFGEESTDENRFTYNQRKGQSASFYDIKIQKDDGADATDEGEIFGITGRERNVKQRHGVGGVNSGLEEEGEEEEEEEEVEEGMDVDRVALSSVAQYSEDEDKDIRTSEGEDYGSGFGRIKPFESKSLENSMSKKRKSPDYSDDGLISDLSISQRVSDFEDDEEEEGTYFEEGAT